MGFDLTIGVATISVLSVLAYVVGRWLGLKRQRWTHFYFAVSLMATACFAWGLSGKLCWAALLPSAWVLAYSNLTPILLSLSAGFAGSAHRGPFRSRFVTVASLALLTAGYLLTPMVRPWLAPAVLAEQPKWTDQVCLQTHPSSCAPAAAATLLRSAGIPAEESRLADMCLTSQFGTEPLSLFRGLSIVASKHSMQPRVASSDPLSWSGENQLPNIALVQFKTSSANTGQRILGGAADQHAVVILGRTVYGSWRIADPAFGATTWSNEEFNARFTGDAIYLASRYP